MSSRKEKLLLIPIISFL